MQHAGFVWFCATRTARFRSWQVQDKVQELVWSPALWYRDLHRGFRSKTQKRFEASTHEQLNKKLIEVAKSIDACDQNDGSEQELGRPSGHTTGIFDDWPQLDACDIASEQETGRPSDLIADMSDMASDIPGTDERDCTQSTDQEVLLPSGRTAGTPDMLGGTLSREEREEEQGRPSTHMAAMSDILRMDSLDEEVAPVPGVPRECQTEWDESIDKKTEQHSAMAVPALGKASKSSSSGKNTGKKRQGKTIKSKASLQKPEVDKSEKVFQPTAGTPSTCPKLQEKSREQGKTTEPKSRSKMVKNQIQKRLATKAIKEHRRADAIKWTINLFLMALVAALLFLASRVNA